VIATINTKQVRGIPAGTYWFQGDHATKLVGKSILTEITYKLPPKWLQKLINK
jgi:hypothetical protein